MKFWGLILGIPLLAFGGALVFFPQALKKASMFFRSSRAVAAVLTVSAWFWTAYECDNIGIDVFDAVTKRFPGELWILAAVLSYLTFVWMPKNLPVRALCGLLMLAPAELFPVTHAFRPEQGVAFAPIDVVVATGYLCAIAGMYGMFYPWRLEKGFDAVAARPVLSRVAGLSMAALGAAVAAVAFCV